MQRLDLAHSLGGVVRMVVRPPSSNCLRTSCEFERRILVRILAVGRPWTLRLDELDVELVRVAVPGGETPIRPLIP